MEEVQAEQKEMPEVFTLNEIKMRESIAKWIDEGKKHWASHFDEVDNYVKRYEAKRSISGLMGWGDDPKANPKNVPWSNASDIGIPLEAFTIEGLLPRFLKVCYGAKPNVWVRGRGDSDLADAEVVQDALNFQVSTKMRICRSMKLVFKSTAMSGDGIAKCVWEEEFKIVNKVKHFLVNPQTNQKIPNPETGDPYEVDRDFEPQPDEMGNLPSVVKEIVSEQIKSYDSPKVYPRSLKNFIIPKDADTSDIQALDWCSDEYLRTLDWVKHRIGEPTEGKFREDVVRELEQDVQGRATDKENSQFSKVLISEWHGRYDINGDGLEEEIVVFLARPLILGNFLGTSDYKNDRMLGWMITPYPKRPFFHYQIIPMENSFYGKGIPEFLIGIRNLVDAIFNQMIDRGSITNNPPIKTPLNYDPDESPFGPGCRLATDNPEAFGVLELPKNEQMEFSKMEFLLGMVQKLFGVSDYSLGQDTGNQRTATGILSIIGEGNVKFDDMIRALQDVNEELYEFIVDLNADYLTDDFIYYLTEQTGNPFKKISQSKWGGAFDFEAVGNSVNINREVEQNRATMAYTTAMQSYQKNPFINDDVMRTVTQNFFRSIDMRNIKLPTIDEVEAKQREQLAQTIQEMQAKALQQTPQGQRPATAQPQVKAVESGAM
jgi:hypothetical protein